MKILTYNSMWEILEELDKLQLLRNKVSVIIIDSDSIMVTLCHNHKDTSRHKVLKEEISEPSEDEENED